MWKLLVIDDEPDRIEQVADWFAPIGFEIIEARSGKEGLIAAKTNLPDIIVLDMVFPHDTLNGHEILLKLKRDPVTHRIPVVIRSFKADTLDGLQDLVQSGLREGADFVVAKKWGWVALEEVIKKLLESSDRQVAVSVGKNNLILGEDKATVWLNGVQISLTPLEARVLSYLIENRERVCSIAEIEAGAWNEAPGSKDENRVRRVIERLRSKIEPDSSNPIFLLTMHKLGYKFAG